jgi:transposase, IS5 family
VLKHMRNWRYGVLEREVRANLVYRDFTRVGGAKVPDAKTMGRWGVAVGPVVVKQIHERIVQIARDHRMAQGQSPPFFLASPWGTAAWGRAEITGGRCCR